MRLPSKFMYLHPECRLTKKNQLLMKDYHDPLSIQTKNIPETGKDGLMDPDDPTRSQMGGVNNGKSDQHYAERETAVSLIRDSMEYFKFMDLNLKKEYIIREVPDFKKELMAVAGGFFTPDTYQIAYRLRQRNVPEKAIQRVEKTVIDIYRQIRNNNRKRDHNEHVQEFVGRQLVEQLSDVFVNPKAAIRPVVDEIWVAVGTHRGIIDRVLWAIPGMSPDERNGVLARIIGYALTKPEFYFFEKEIFSSQKTMEHMGDFVKAVFSAEAFMEKHQPGFCDVCREIQGYYAEIFESNARENLVSY